MAEFYGVPIEDYQEGQKWQMENFPGTLFVVRRADVQYCLADVPEKKSDLVDGKYRLSTAAGGKAAVKITDMLGEEMLMVEG